MSPRLPRGLALPLAALVLLSSGCLGLFEPDVPEPPLSQECASDFQGDYTSPTAVLQTLTAAMFRKARGRCAYLAAFADSANDRVSYRATFPAELVAERVALEQDVPVWTRPAEAVFYGDFMELSDTPYALVWSDYAEAGSDVGEGADSTLFRRYVINPSGGAEILAAGTAVLVFQRLPAGNWVLKLWSDGVDMRRLDPANGIDEAALRDMTLSQRRLEAYDANF